MENKKETDKFEISSEPMAYKITLKKLIQIIIIVIIIVILIIGGIQYYNNKQEELRFSSLNSALSEINEETETYDDSEKEEFEKNVDYDYLDYISIDDETTNTEDVEIAESDSDEYIDEAYDTDEERIYNIEYATEYIYAVQNNPLYAISCYKDAYDFAKSLEKQPDGSYNLKLNFNDLCEDMYSSGLYPSVLKSNEILKNNIKVLSEEQINLKDTENIYLYASEVLSFENIETDKYKSYVCINELDENYNHDVYKYLDVTATFDPSSNLIKDITITEISKDELPLNIGIQENNKEYSYNDYLSQ